MNLATSWRPSWIKNSKWGYVHQWVTIDNVHAWPCPGDIIKYWDLTAERSILTNPKSAVRRPYWIRPKFFLPASRSHDRSWFCSIWMRSIHSSELATEWFPYGHFSFRLDFDVHYRFNKSHTTTVTRRNNLLKEESVMDPILTMYYCLCRFFSSCK